MFDENSCREITWLSWRHRFGKAAFAKRFPSTLTRKPGVIKFRFEERFRKRIGEENSVFVTWTVGLTVEIKQRFQICLSYCGLGLRPYFKQLNPRSKYCLLFCWDDLCSRLLLTFSACSRHSTKSAQYFTKDTVLWRRIQRTRRKTDRKKF